MSITLLLPALIFLGAFMGLSLMTADFYNHIQAANAYTFIPLMGLITGGTAAGSFLIAGSLLFIKAVRSRS